MEMIRTLLVVAVLALVSVPAASADAPTFAMQPAMQLALAITGAPASTSVSCSVNVPLGENGWAQWSPDSYILLQPSICNGLIWLQDPGLRWYMQRKMPFIGWVGQAGVSALVALHESTHIAGDHDETDTECRAMSELHQMLLGFTLTADQIAQAERTAQAYDMFLPALYHEHAC